MKLSLLLCLLLPLSIVSMIAQDAPPSVPASTPVLTGPLQIQENPVPPPAPAATPDATATSPVVAPVDTNASSNPVQAVTPTTAEPPAPATDSGMGSPGQPPPPSDPNSLIPPPQEALPPSPINSAGNEEKQRQDQKALYYTVKVKADKEEALSSLLEQADKAKSDEAKRQALREYYDLLAKRMKKLDSSLSSWIDTMHAAYLRRMDQVRVEPTIPLNPPPVPANTGEVSATPSPTPAHKKRRKSVDATASPTPTPASKKKASVSSDN